MKIALGGGAPMTLASAQVGAGAIAVDADAVYWTTADFPNESVMKVGSEGGTPVTLASGQDDPLSIAVDSTSVYWTNVRQHRHEAHPKVIPMLHSLGQRFLSLAVVVVGPALVACRVTTGFALAPGAPFADARGVAVAHHLAPHACPVTCRWNLV